ncbi:cysteine rich repeat-containing protein [Mesorhizobium koreense]|jgi:hypothetical protein|uniref:cysteine rich repeat-containing protein n=1 Tax=Mesorhizobium koreense TaxID=3074855 RepID=UPI00287B78D0|nr:cysteine rich repeat-containing protein [Mesorhizobium sp. WR6]
MHTLRMVTILLFSAGVFSVLPFGSAAYAQSLDYCKKDAARLCKGVQMGEGRMLKCLKAHEDDLTVGCAKELKTLKAKMGK